MSHQSVNACQAIRKKNSFIDIKGPFKRHVTQRGVKFHGKKRYEGLRFNIINVTRGGFNFPGKRFKYVTLE